MKSESRRKEILDAFECLVKQYGIDKTTIHEVANNLNMSVGLLYNEFSGKDELIDGLLERMHFKLNIDFHDESNELSIEEKLKNALVGFVEKASINIRENKAMFNFIEGIAPTKYLRKKIDMGRHMMQKRIFDKIEQILHEGNIKNIFQIDDVHQMAIIIFDAFEGYRFPPLMIEREHEILMRDANKMFEMVLKTIKTK